nr:MAG TPA: hypothetical protein [Bacteriophage sp.]
MCSKVGKKGSTSLEHLYYNLTSANFQEKNKKKLAEIRYLTILTKSR